MKRVGPATLKCVVPVQPETLGAVKEQLASRAGEDDVRVFGQSVVLVHTAEPTSALRDWLSGSGALLVVEFETWSGSGSEVPREWLLARGH